VDMYNKVPKAPRTDMYTTTLLTAGNFVHVTMPTRQTHIMSILNTTPDSFSDGGSNALDPQSLRETAAAHIAAGATIIDVGGQSSRPNAPDVTAEEEINRVLPAIAAIRSLPEAKGIAISVDTYRAAVAEAAINAGADIVNDISAGKMDSQMLQTVARLGCTYIMMHMRGTPATMQNPENCEYAGGLGVNIGNELLERIEDATKAGVRKWRLILDPGIGFAKTQEQNVALLSMTRILRHPEIEFKKRTKGMPWLVGSSRKGFIGKITGVTEPKDRVWGTAVAVAASIQGGADIVRVHDVKEMAQVAKMADALRRQNAMQAHAAYNRAGPQA
jgi:dihydropteroate synthase